MTCLRALGAIGCLAGALAATARAQVPAVPATVPAAVPAAAPSLGFFASLGMACKAKKERCCNSPLGKMLATIVRPMHAMTGGILPTCCPPGPSAAELAAPGPVGAAAKIKAEEAQAKARREAVKYLATVDCHYYPEAEATLIGALRCDRNECVRWEAAHALGTGCCCNKRTIEALTITVTGSEKDGNPGETSMRVRAEALAALQFCLAHCQEPPARPEVPLPPEQPSASDSPGTGSIQLTAYYQQVAQKPWDDVIRQARQAIGQTTLVSETTSHLPPPGQRNLISLWHNAARDAEQSADRAPTPVPQPAMPASPPLPSPPPSASPPMPPSPPLGPAGAVMPPMPPRVLPASAPGPFSAPPSMPRSQPLDPPLPRSR